MTIRGVNAEGMTDRAQAMDAYLRLHYPDGVTLSTGDRVEGVKDLFRKLRARLTLREVAQEVNEIIRPLKMGTVSDEVIRQWLKAWEHADLKQAVGRVSRRVSR